MRRTEKTAPSLSRYHLSGNPPAPSKSKVESSLAPLVKSAKPPTTGSPSGKLPNLPSGLGNGPLAKQALSAAASGDFEIPDIGSGSNCPECVLKDLYKKYLLKHNKTYADQYEEENHFNKFQEAINRIKELNSKKTGPLDAMFATTKFSDFPFADFLKKFTGALKELNPAEKFEFDIGSMIAGVPEKFDWRDEGVVPEIRNQQDCGSCYAFSTSDLLGIQWPIDHEETKPYVLAPQYAIDCIHDQAAFGCDGGRPYLVLQSNANCTGDKCAWAREDCYKYQNAAGKTCREPELACTQGDKPLIQVKQAYYLDVSSGGGKVEKERLGALLQGGPVVALVTVTDHWQHYNGGIMRGSQCQGSDSQPNHAALIVGYNFTDPSNSYYIIRNTWDTDWGEKGYFKMEAGANACGIAQFLSFACTADCGDGRSSKFLLERARKRLQKKGITQPGLPGATTPAAYGQQTSQPQAYPTAEVTGYSAAPPVYGKKEWQQKFQQARRTS